MSNADPDSGDNGAYSLEVVWENITSELAEEAKELWVRENALPRDETVENRVRQLLVVARDRDKKLIAVSTAERRRVPELLNNIFYYYRVFVAAEHRNKGIALPVSNKAREYLHQRFLNGQDTLAKGFYVAIENSILQKVHTQAVLVVGGIDHPFIGVDRRGRYLRVGWFDDARIS